MTNISYSTKLPEELIKRLKLQAVEENRRANDIIIEALDKYLSDYTKEAK